MKIAVIGTGYVGLVQGTCLAESGNDVVCVDKIAVKVQGLTQGRVPIYEPGLGELVHRNLRDGRLTFTTDLAGGIADRDRGKSHPTLLRRIGRIKRQTQPTILCRRKRGRHLAKQQRGRIYHSTAQGLRCA